MPRERLPEITLVSSGAGPPILLSTPPEREMPVPLPWGMVPDPSVPMRFPRTMLPDEPPVSQMPFPTLPEITLSAIVPFGVPDVKIPVAFGTDSLPCSSSPMTLFWITMNGALPIQRPVEFPETTLRAAAVAPPITTSATPRSAWIPL